MSIMNVISTENGRHLYNIRVYNKNTRQITETGEIDRIERKTSYKIGIRLGKYNG